MKNLKVRIFHPSVRNAIIFIGLSLLFRVLQESLQSGLPFLNATFLWKVARDDWFVLVVAVLAITFCALHAPSGPRLFAVFSGVVAFRALEGLFLNFDKLVLVLLFFQVVFSYAFYQLLSWTFRLAPFVPNFRMDDIYAPTSPRIPITFFTRDRSWTGCLTNWDEHGAFALLDTPLPDDVHIAEAKVEWAGGTFLAKGAVVTGTWDGRGIGIEWRNGHQDGERGWRDFTALFSDLGYDPVLLR